jgi:uncharacterized membrane protein
MSSVWSALKRYFFSGVLVVVPIILTYIVLKFLFDVVDGILSPLLNRIFGYYVTGLGLLTTVLIIILAGVLTRNLLGARLYHLGDRLLRRMPVIRPVYSAAKQLLESLAAGTGASFKEVGLIEYPRLGSYSVCFVANRLMVLRDGRELEHVVAFIPSTPTPFSGMVVLIQSTEVTILEMTVEEAVKFLVSGGIVSPTLLRARLTEPPTGQE